MDFLEQVADSTGSVFQPQMMSGAAAQLLSAPKMVPDPFEIARRQFFSPEYLRVQREKQSIGSISSV